MFDFIRRALRKHFGKEREQYRLFEELLGIAPDNIDLYKLALVHRSASIILPDGQSVNNERLEFLGDAVLEAIVSDFLFVEYPQYTEGYLTQLRSRIVSRTSMDEIAIRMGLDKAIVASSASGINTNKHLCGNALEAIIGAVYLDKGYDFTNRYVINHIICRYVDVGDMTQTESDHKSRLIEWCQKGRRNIVFNTTADPTGSRNGSPRFHTTIIIEGIEFGCGRGTSKKEAEQMAAGAAMALVRDDVGDDFLQAIDDIAQNGTISATDRVN